MRPHRTQVAALLAGSAAVTLLAGCLGGSDANKSGASVKQTTVLRLAMPDVGDSDGAYFAHVVERRSDGRVQIRLDNESYDNADTAAEARLAPALESGAEQAGYMPARDWAARGVPAFRALSAPFAVTTQAAMQRVAASEFARAALASLKSKHVVGLGLVPSEPRRLLSRRPLMTPADFRAASLRVVLNPDVSRAVSALGGTPASVRQSSRVKTLLREGELTGAETSPQLVLSNGYASAAPYFTAFGFSAKFQVIAVSDRAWSSLDGAQRSALRAAAADTVAHARSLPDREAHELAALCHQHTVITQASSGRVAAIAAAGKVDSTAYANAARAIAAVPGTGPQASATPIPNGCRVAHDRVDAIAELRKVKGERPAAVPKSKTATIPTGTYDTTITVGDWRRGGQYGADWNEDITFTFRIEDGRWYETQKPDYPDQGPCGGTYTLRGDEVTFHFGLKHGACTELDPETLRWSYYNGQLSFKLVDVSDSASKVTYIAHPWRKTG